MGEALTAWALKQAAKAPMAPALSAWATFAQMAPRTQVLTLGVQGLSRLGTSTTSATTSPTAFVIRDPYR